MSKAGESLTEPVIFSGPSGVGKTYMVKHIAGLYRAERLVPTTTREKRPGETDMVDSHFLSEDEFTDQESDGRLFLASGHLSARYAFEHDLLRGIVERRNVPLVEIYTPKIRDTLGVMATTRTVFLRPPSIDYLEDRMAGRGQSPEDIAYRLRKAEEEIAYFDDEGHQYYQDVYTVDTANFGSVVTDIVQTLDLTRRD